MLSFHNVLAGGQQDFHISMKNKLRLIYMNIFPSGRQASDSQEGLLWVRMQKENYIVVTFRFEFKADALFRNEMSLFPFTLFICFCIERFLS